MKRVQEIKLFLQDEKNFLIKKRIEKIKSLCAESDIWQRELEVILKELTVKKEKNHLVIAWLRSSYITGRHIFYIAGYEKEPFVEEEPDSFYYSVRELLAEVVEDRKMMEMKLQSNFTRIFPSETEEIFRWYMEGLYMALGNVFEEILRNIPTENNLNVYFGGYMDELKLIGKI